MTASVRLPAAADPTRSSPAQNPRLGAPRAAMPIGDGQTTDRKPLCVKGFRPPWPGPGRLGRRGGESSQGLLAAERGQVEEGPHAAECLDPAAGSEVSAEHASASCRHGELLDGQLGRGDSGLGEQSERGGLVGGDLELLAAADIGAVAPCCSWQVYRASAVHAHGPPLPPDAGSPAGPRLVEKVQHAAFGVALAPSAGTRSLWISFSTSSRLTSAACAHGSPPRWPTMRRRRPCWPFSGACLRCALRRRS